MCVEARIHTRAILAARAHALLHRCVAIGLGSLGRILRVAARCKWVALLTLAKRNRGQREATEARTGGCFRPPVARFARELHIVDAVAVGVRWRIGRGRSASAQSHDNHDKFRHRIHRPRSSECPGGSPLVRDRCGYTNGAELTSALRNARTTRSTKRSPISTESAKIPVATDPSNV